MNLRESIFISAFDLFLKYGIKRVSMDDICRKTGISKKTCYNVIATKEDLVFHVLKSHLARDEQEIVAILENSSNAIDAMVNISKHVLKFLAKMTPTLIYDLKRYHPHAWEKIEERHFPFIEKMIFNNLKRGQKEGLYRKDLNAVILSKLYVLQSLSISDQQHFSPEEFSKVDLYKEMIRYHLNGIISEEGKLQIIQNHKNFFTI